MERDPLHFLVEMARQYGDVVRLPLTFGTTYLVNHPDGIRQVLQEHAARYGKDPHENAIFKRFVGMSVLTSEGDAWQRIRHLEQPAFGRRHLAMAGAQVVEAAQGFLDGWHDRAARGELIDLVPAMQALTLSVLGKTVFSLDLSQDIQAIAEALNVMNHYALALFYHPWLPYLGPLSASNRRGQTAQRALDDVVLRLIRERRAHLSAKDGSPEDLLTFLLQVRENDGVAAFSDAQIRNETLSILIAGHDNSSSLLCWIWYLLARYPEVAEHLFREVVEILHGRTPGLEDLDRLPYSKLVVEETLRLYPPAWSFPRRVLADDVIGGYRIPKGATVLLCPYTTHRHPAFWADPETFNPERMRSPGQAGRPRYVHFPFGGGQRQCMGATFAMIEAQLALVLVAQRYRLELEPAFVLQPEPLVTLRPRALPMRLRLLANEA